MPVYVTTFSTFEISSRQSPVTRSPMRNERPIPKLKVNGAGPRIEFRPALPHSPVAGAANAAGFTYDPSTCGSVVTPVRLARIGPVNPVAPTGARYTGVNGIALPVLRRLVNVHPLKSRPFQPVSSAPPVTP